MPGLRAVRFGGTVVISIWLLFGAGPRAYADGPGAKGGRGLAQRLQRLSEAPGGRGAAARVNARKEKARTDKHAACLFEKLATGDTRFLESDPEAEARARELIGNAVAESDHKEVLINAKLAEDRPTLDKRIEEELDNAIVALGPRSEPWRTTAGVMYDIYTKALREEIENKLRKMDTTFSRLSPRDQTTMLQGAMAELVGKLSSWPNLVTAGIGVGVPLGTGLMAKLALPDTLAGIIGFPLGLLTAPFTGGVVFFLNSKLGPVFAPKMGSNINLTKFQNDLQRIGFRSTALPQPFKDGRNIDKDAYLVPVEILTAALKRAEAARKMIDLPKTSFAQRKLWTEKKYDEAREAVAYAVLYHVAHFPEATMDPIVSNHLYTDLHWEFGSPERFEKIAAKIRAVAPEYHFSSSDVDDAIARLKLLIKPEHDNPYLFPEPTVADEAPGSQPRTVRSPSAQATVLGRYGMRRGPRRRPSRLSDASPESSAQDTTSGR